MSETADPGAEASATAETPVTETPEAAAAPEGSAAPETGAGEAPEGDAAPAPEEPKKPKSPVAQLQGRVGHLTKTLHEKDAELTSERQRREALEALFAARGETPGDVPNPGTPPARAATPAVAPGTPEFERLVKEEADRRAFNVECNTILDTGAKKFGAEFTDGVGSLNALGLMSIPLVQAAIATGAAPEVIHALGNDTEEAARIASLPPVQMGVELAKLAGSLRRDPKEISKVPPPLNPVRGSVKAEIDIADPNLSMDEYVARRKQQGSRWAR